MPSVRARWRSPPRSSAPSRARRGQAARGSGTGGRAGLSSDVLPPPGVDAGVVAGEKHVRTRPPPELGGARVLRILERTGELGGESLHLPRSLGERAREAACD